MSIIVPSDIIFPLLVYLRTRLFLMETTLFIDDARLSALATADSVFL
jgi:hypothetical protein